MDSIVSSMVRVAVLLFVTARLFKLVIEWLIVLALVVLLVVAAAVAMVRHASSHGMAFVADASLFSADIPCPALVDGLYLENPAVTIYVDPRVAGTARDGVPADGAHVVTDATRPPALSPWRSGALADAEVTVLETALRRRLPVLSVDATALVRRVQTDAATRARYLTVQILDPCTAPVRR